MPTDCISYQKSGYFSKLIVDYLDEKTELQAFYNRFPKLENFKAQLDEKQQNFSPENRSVLVSELQSQYSGFSVSKATATNIELLNQNATFTVTTGHQLNLFTGPLYFLYKIVSTINLCQELKKAYPNHNFVPVYWMATEDHDFEEINYFNFKNIKIRWNRESNGPVGRLSTDGLQDIFTVFSEELGIGQNSQELKTLFERAYLKHATLAAATRFLVNELFGEKGLMILDGDSVALKKLFIPFAEKELVKETSFQEVDKTNSLLSKNYDIQANPREINLFYIEDHIRERIVLENSVFKIKNTNLEFSEDEILALLQKNPEKFSPNVILRPLYQEVVLPNLCYIGGGGEIAYWLQLKSTFASHDIVFPMLLVRNSVLLCTEKQSQKADRLNLCWEDLFSNQQELFNRKTADYSNFNLDFSEQKDFLKQQFNKLHEIAAQTDKSFLGALKAQEARQIKGLENLEKRLVKAEKKVHAEKLDRILALQNELFPNQGLQERKANFSEFYLDAGNALIEKLFQNLHPLKHDFTIITL